MSSSVVRIGDHPAPRVEDYLGPAEVTHVDGHETRVSLPTGAEVLARLALAFPYAPAPGDTLLVIGKGASYYVIGVLQGSGRSVFTLPGDVAISAAGALELEGGTSVRIRGPEVSIQGGKLQLVADAVMQSFASAYQRVSGLLSVHAGRSHTLVDDVSYAQAKSAAIVTEETVTINGKEVHLC